MVLTKILTFIYSYPLLSFLQNIRRFLKLTHFAWFSTKVLEAYERYTNIDLHPGAHLAYICTVLINLECKSIFLNGALEKKTFREKP